MASSGTIKYASSNILFEKSLKSYEADTMTNFVVLTKDKAFGQEDPTPGHKKIMWELKHVPFNGVPFMVVGRKVYSCHRGYDKHRRAKQTKRKQLDDHSDHSFKESRRILQDTKKLDCPARISVVHIIRFPGYKIPAEVAKQKMESAKRLKFQLATNSSAVTFEQQYVLCLPGLGEHRNHPVVDEAAQVREAVDPRVELTTPPRDAIPANPHPGNKTTKWQKCCSLLREISDLTNHLQDLPFLDSVITRLTDLLEDVRLHTPHDETLPLSYAPPSKKTKHTPTSTMARPVKPALSMVPQKHTFSGRVGRHAEVMRSCFKPPTGFQPQPQPQPPPGNQPPPRPPPGNQPQPRPPPGNQPQPQPPPGNQPPPRPAPGNQPQPRPPPGNQPQPRPPPGNQPQPRPTPGNQPQPRPTPGNQPPPRPAPGNQPQPRPPPGNQPQPQPPPGNQPQPQPPPGNQPPPRPPPGNQPQPRPPPGNQPQPQPPPGNQPPPRPPPGNQPQPRTPPGNQPQPQPQPPPGNQPPPRPAPGNQPQPQPPPGNQPPPRPAPGNQPRPPPGNQPQPQPLPGNQPQPRPPPGNQPQPRPPPGNQPQPRPTPGNQPT